MSRLIVPTTYESAPRLVAQQRYANIAGGILSVLGSTGTIIPLGEWGHDTLSVCTTIGDEQVAFTHSSALSAWATPFTRDPNKDQWQGSIPFIVFDGAADESDSPDAAFWSTAGAFSIGAWVYLNTAASNVILAKWDLTDMSELREWIFEVDSNGDIGMTIYDESENAAVGRQQATALVTGQWYFLVGTFDGGTDAAGVSIAVDGALTDDGDIVDDAGFANSEDLATVVSLGYRESTLGAKENFLDAKVAGGPLGPFFVLKELTADEINNLYNIGRAALGV
ncbi:MAG: hypothetical protein J3T61_04635 [Candidatus Brocadiales bacterium]|nr:hypothetical protein [Candidatus Bathyanammoxibius sp.]